MQAPLLPLFPLGVVLFPGAPLPLHIFEDRYKEMIGDAIKRKEEFGVVLAAEKGIANMGCTATVEQIFQKYEDGRMDILTVGRRRFEIHLLNEERDYLRGDVSFFDDEEDDIAPMEMRNTIAQLGSQLDPAGHFDIDDPLLSFSVAQKMNDLELKQVVLSMRSENDRIRHLVQQTPIYLGRQKLIEHVKKVAPTNGHSKHWKEGS